MRISYPPQLPVSERRAEIARTIRDHQVVVVAGETGSGKTTQLPKICLELGRTRIAHTQPRRLAARTVAERIAEELDVALGAEVGYTIRFTDQARRDTRVRLMTDGILLAEIQRDPELRRYDTIIIDEAHERSLNIDFLLGYLHRLLPRRTDMKLIITSATIDPQRFSDHFGGAPVVEVSGRMYPVEIRYRPAERDDDRTDAVVDAVRELCADGPGDILVFLSGEREIRDTAEVLRGLDLPATEVLPLYARLAAAEQHRVWEPHPGRRIVLGTNVAETSLTVPGIRYVIDPGTARISRYSRRTKVQRLPIEAISRASADQRAGRCGRVSAGICIRLYEEADFNRRPEFTEPEILRTNLASVILQMAALGLGPMSDFPFVDPPDRRSVRDGTLLLDELGALDGDRLTEIGRQLARLPVDPRIGRMIIEAGREGCVREVLILASALSIPDPRERPLDRQAEADQHHSRFADDKSDFSTLLNLWKYVRDRQKDLSGNQFRRMCRDEFLHYLRIREWQDLRGQLRQIAADLGLTESARPADSERVHSCVLAGVLSHVGLRIANSREYQGARGATFLLSPGSVLARRPPPWVVAAELVETSRLYAHTAARVEPSGIERLAEHLVERTYSEPHWDRGRGAVMGYERVTLYGLPLVTRRRVAYGRIDPVVARDLFLRHALVEGEWGTGHRFLRDNRALLDEVGELEVRARRRDLLVSADELFDFYDARVPAEVVSARHFDAWWKQARQATPQLLTLRRKDVLRAPEPERAPSVMQDGDLELPLTYRFDPGAPDDGVTVHVPVDVLARLGGADFGWHVPALREELVTELLRSLPKELRRRLVPVPDTARAVLAEWEPGREPLLDGLQRALHRLRGVLVPLTAFDLDKIPDHLRVTFAVEDGSGELARGKDLGALQEQLAGRARAAVAARFEVERDGLTDWPADLPVLPHVVSREAAGRTIEGYPALADGGIRVFATRAEQATSMATGTRALLRATVPSPARAVHASLDARGRLVVGAGGGTELLDDIADAALDELVRTHGGPVWTAAEFAVLRDAVRAELPSAAIRVATRAIDVLAAAQRAQAEMPPGPGPAVADMTAQLDRLVGPGFVTAAGAHRLADLLRYVRAVRRRAERVSRDPALDAARMVRVHHVEDAYAALRAALPPARSAEPDVADIGWMIEELRVSMFAQQLGTARPVSELRILRAIDQITP